MAPAMHSMTLSEASSAASALTPRSSTTRRSRSPTSPTTRGRSAPGALFFCVRGSHADGHAFAATAAAAGAVALVVEHPGGRWRCRSSSLPTRARRWPRRRRSSSATRRDELAVAGVTGTNGKTTTAFLLRRDPRRAAGRRTGLLTNIERLVAGEERPVESQHAGGDRPPAALSGDGSTAATRVRDGGDVDRAGAGAARRNAVRVLVFTNLTQDHLDFHGTMEDYFEAKRALFDQADRAVVQCRRRIRAPARRARPARCNHLRRELRRARRHRPEAARRLQPLERDRRRARRALARCRRRCDQARDRVGARCSRTLRVDRGRTSRSP